MSDISGRSSPVVVESDWESDIGTAGLEAGSPASPVVSTHTPSPQKADVPSDDVIRPYAFRIEDFNPVEKNWFERIRTFEPVDLPDAPGGAAHNLHLAAGGTQQQYTNQLSTTAFGKLHFEGEDSRGVQPAWFVRLAVNTPKDLIEDLLKTKFEVSKSSSYPIRIHCIDYDRWPSSMNPPLPINKDDLEGISIKLQRDLCSMCRKTAGVLLTWSGLEKSNIVHQALFGIMEDSRRTKRHYYNMAAIATPPWNALDPDVREKIRQAKGENIHLKSDMDLDDFVPEVRSSIGPEISQYATHFLFLDDDTAVPGHAVLESDLKKTNFRHFHRDMIEAIENSMMGQGRLVEMPVVCILINGYHDALKMVWNALKKDIPVVIVKGSGGYADIIADVYFSAVHETIKEWDPSGQVRTRITKKAGLKGNQYMKEDEAARPFLQEIFNKLDMLTIYVPALSVQTLDSVVFEALLKNKQESKFEGLVKIMKKSKNMHQIGATSSERLSFIDSDEVQMDYFIEALKQNCVQVVKIFLDELEISKKFMHHFHLGRVLRLYSQNANVRENLITFRREFANLLHKLKVLPLSCLCDDCANCNVTSDTKSEVSELAVQRTCLHPIQELFLWALHDRHVELAIVFWQRCDDKIAAALVARKVFKTMAKQQEDPDPDFMWQMDQNVRTFQDLAISTLRSCHNMNEVKTELLLTKPCPWWGDMSVLQLAILSENKEFMAETACKKIMTRIWRRHPFSDPRIDRTCKLLDTPSDDGCLSRLQRCSPVTQYAINFFMQGAFLALFSATLLFDVKHDLVRGLTINLILLMVWVLGITLEEFRQFLSKPAVLRDSNKKLRISRSKFYTYCTQHWNLLDMVTIVLFWLGIIVFFIPGAQEWGRVVLCFDVFFFYMRTFQMLMVWEGLGLLLEMVYRMMKDTVFFMIILLIFVLAYAVMSESMLYPYSEPTWPRLFHLPRKAYWQVFGELSLSEIENREKESCSENQSMHSGFDTPQCPTEYGSYIVPFLMGIHVMITNVLLLNLLIARFGQTFSQVQGEAEKYQSWHRCQIITEYYNRPAYPPPFNVPYTVCYFLAKLVIKLKRCLCACCSRPRRRPADRGQGDNAVGMEMSARGHQGQIDRNAAPGSSGVAGEQNPLLGTKSLKAWWSTDKQSVRIEWTNQLPLKRAPQTAEQKQPVYHVDVADSDQQSPFTTETYEVARKAAKNVPRKQAFTVWYLESNKSYNIAVEDVSVNPEPQLLGNLCREELLGIAQFEERQADWVCHQEDSDGTDAGLKDLQNQTAALRTEVSKMTEELEQQRDTLMTGVSSLSQELKNNCAVVMDSSKLIKQNAKNLQKVKDSAEKNKKRFEDVNENFTKLTSYLEKEDQKRKDTEKKFQDMTRAWEREQVDLQQSLQTLRGEVTTVLHRQEALQQQMARQQEQHQTQVQRVLSQLAQAMKLDLPAPDSAGDSSA